MQICISKSPLKEERIKSIPYITCFIKPKKSVQKQGLKSSYNIHMGLPYYTNRIHPPNNSYNCTFCEGLYYIFETLNKKSMKKIKWIDHRLVLG